jgi:hypothetical protein
VLISALSGVDQDPSVVKEDHPMSRTRTPDHASTETSTPETTTAVAEPPAAEAKAEGKSFAERVGKKKSVTIPDPFPIATDKLAGVRLFESKTHEEMAIKFDEKPNPAVLAKMHEAHWQWQPADKVWTHPVTPESAMSTRIEAERLYQEVRLLVRQDKGIEAGKEVPF